MFQREVIIIKGKNLVCIFSGILIIALILLSGRDAGKAEKEKGIPEETTETKEELYLSAKSGFYDKDTELSVMSAKEGEIYYTCDGSQPDRSDTEHTHLYEEPVLLTAGEEETVSVYKFKAYFEDGTESETITGSYFMGTGIRDRYDTLVLSLTAEDDDLYGYENGIFVEGKLRDDWLEAHPGEETAYDTPANYNVRGRQSERNVYVELFEPDGKRVIAQNGGIRISGNFTRQSEQKSFKLYARAEYDMQNKFRYPVFDDMRSLNGGAIFDKFHSLKVRNTGNDRSEGFIRDELGLTLAAQAGFTDTQSVRPVSVYINGKYQGLYWIHTTYDNDYFEERYGDFTGEMVVIGNSEMDMSVDTEDELSNRYAKEYNELYARFGAEDLTDDGMFKELDSVIDVKNYLRYFALEVYMSNRDWPFNNIEAYRYVADDNQYTEGTVFDGRYRYLLYDVDTTMGLGSVRDSLDPNQSFDTLVMLEERNYAPLFTALMKREDCRQYFASYICDLMNGAYSPENVADVLAGMHELRKNEMGEYIEESVRNPDLPEIGEAYLEMQMDCINAWAEATPKSMINGIADRWSLGNVYSLHASLFDGDGMQINSLLVTDSEYSGRYLTGCQTSLSPVIREGRAFSYWEINGEPYMEEEIVLDEGMIIDGSVYVTLYTEEENAGLVLSEICSKGKEDYIVLTNTSEEEVSTWGYYLMDKEKASHMNYLEETFVAPGESIRIGCKNYSGSDALMNVNFNLKRDRTLSLAYSIGGIKETVTIPDLGIEQGSYRKNLLTGEWQEEGGS